MTDTNSTPHHVPVEWLDEPGPAGTPAAATTAAPAARGSEAQPSRTPSPTMQGWAYFGAVMMALMGGFQAILGLVALFDKSYFHVRENTLLVTTSYTAYGWLHLIGGLVAVAAGIGVVLAGRPWSRITAIVVAALSALINLGFLAASPVWSTLVIALDVVVIYALTVHGWEMDRS